MYKIKKKIKFFYHLNFWIYYFFSNFFYQKPQSRSFLFAELESLNSEEQIRVNYYNKLQSKFTVNSKRANSP